MNKLAKSSFANLKLNLLFDVSVLANGAQMTTARSGVFFVAYNLLLEMLNRKNLSVKLYCSEKERRFVEEVISKDKNLTGVQFIGTSKIYNNIAYFEKLKYENKKKRGNKIVRFFIKMVLSSLKILFKLNVFIGSESKLYKDIDVFFSPWGMVPNELKSIDSIKKFLVVHDIIPLLFPENFPDMKKKYSDLYKQFHFFDKDVHYFANSEYTKMDIVNHSILKGDRITVIPLSTGIPYERVNDSAKILKVREKYNIPKDKKYLFSLCSLEPRKNLVFAVKNFIEFIKQNNIEDFVFVLGGGQWDIFIEQLNKAISDLNNYKDKIIKIGYVDDEDLPALYSGAEMFVFASVYEGFGMPILEAMKCGCPVICSNVASMPEVIGDCGIQINPKNDEDLIKAFEKMYFDDKFRKECSQKGLERAKKFSWEKSVDVIMKKIIEGVNNEN